MVVTGQDKGLQVLVQLGGGLVVKVLDRRFLNCAVPALNLAIGPGKSGFGQAVLQIELAAEAVKTVAAEGQLRHLEPELNAVVNQQGVGLLG